MAEGLKPHHHQYYHLKTIRYYDKVKHCMVKRFVYKCMICGKEYYEPYEYEPRTKRKRYKERKGKNEKRKVN
ncbi:hypothetical protein [Massilimicrobiota timonensis]|uniref:hypothetical protein n=1 Tax=Massilimicrobiota timonensis TaxID=1776392 RepID=UPI00117F8048|nr:hypothetical protein [Massilimicrobiota timonensis]